MISFATTYYISTSGSNANNGSIGSPWLTLTYACSKATNSGDIIHVNAGTYIETAQSSLAVGVSIEGDGITSIIKSHFAPNNANDYISYTIDLKSASEGTNGNQHISNIKMDGDNLTAFGAIRVTKRSNVEIHDCTFIDFNYGGCYFVGWSTPITTYATGNKFYNNTVTNCSGYFPAGQRVQTGGMNALYIKGQDGMLIYNNILDQTSRPSGSNGVLIGSVEGYCKNVKIYNNTITKAPYDNLTWDFALELWSISGGVEIYNNVIIGSIDMGGDVTSKGSSTYSVWIHNNTIGPTSQATYNSTRGILLEESTSDVIIEKNLIKNVENGIYFPLFIPTVAVNNIRISYNIFQNIGTTSGSSYTGYGINWNQTSATQTINNLYVLNNTFIGLGAANNKSMGGIKLPNGGSATNIYIRNNIIKDFYYTPIYAETEISGNTIDYLSIENNIFFNNTRYSTPFYEASITSIHNTTKNNKEANPLFISSTDFRLQVGSPAINAGLNVGLTTDYAGNSISNPLDIGAYEYGSTSDITPAVVTTFTIPATSTSLTVPISSLIASDNVGVTGYLITETSTTPTVGASGWSSAKPTIYTFSSIGAKSLYAWAKDAEGNVSLSRQATTVISGPLATSFSFTGPSTGNVNSSSSNFTVTPNNLYTGTITLTLTGTGSAGLSSKVLTFSNSSTAQTFTIKPTVAGSITLTATNNGTLTNPTNLIFTANAILPDAPTSVVAIAGDVSASVTFIAPTNTGGSAITGYTVTSNPAGGIDANAGSTSLTHSITGLTNGNPCTFTVKATNSIGSSVASVASNLVIPTAPAATTFIFTGPSSGSVNSASTNFTITPNNSYTGTITITPSGTGSTGLLPKVLTFSNSSTAQTFAITPIVAGIITLTATNSGTLTNPANLTYTVNAVVPGAPTSVIATAGNASASVTFVAPIINGGSVITGYTVTSIPAGGIDANAGLTSLTHTITGLINGTSYTFNLKATNSVGSSVASVASNLLIPTAPVATTFIFTGPSSGSVNSASTNFTITPNNSYTGTITITPSGTGSTGLLPKVLTFSNSSTAQTFAITPIVAGIITLTATNSGTLINPANLTYTVNAIVPGAPTSVVATAGNASASVTFVAPIINGGSVITGYTVTSIPTGGMDTNAGSVTLTHLITGLANDISYTFTVMATNSVGNTIASVASNPVIPISANLKQGEILPTHFIPVWQGQNGLNHMNVMVVSATLNDLPITTNDEVALFSGTKCIGAQKLGTTLVATDNSTYLNIIASQDDGTGNGFTNQDTILFKIWDDPNQREMDIQGIIYRTDVSSWLTSGKFVPGGTAVVEIISYTESTQTIQMLKGYNMISASVVASNPDVSIVTQPLCVDGDLIKMQDESGNSYENWGSYDEWVNNLGSIEQTEGYKIKVANDCSLQITGRPVILPLDIPLKTGWNMIPFPCPAPVDAMLVIQTLIDQNKLVKVQDEEGNSIENWGIFGGWQNGIGNFVPGKAYKVKVVADATLNLQENYLKSAVILVNTPRTDYFSTTIEGHGTDHMNLNIVDIRETGLSEGDELAAFDGPICVGTRKLTGNNLDQNIVSLIASFSTDDQIQNGFKSGDPIRILVWKQVGNSESEAQLEDLNGTMTYEKNGSVLLKMKSHVTGKSSLNDGAQIDVFPNPSKGQMTVRFSEMPDANSRIDILDLYGRTIISRNITGTSEEFNLDTQPAGLYLVKTITGSTETTHKLIIRK